MNVWYFKFFRRCSFCFFKSGFHLNPPIELEPCVRLTVWPVQKCAYFRRPNLAVYEKFAEIATKNSRKSQFNRINKSRIPNPESRIPNPTSLLGRRVENYSVVLQGQNGYCRNYKYRTTEIRGKCCTVWRTLMRTECWKVQEQHLQIPIGPCPRLCPDYKQRCF